MSSFLKYTFGFFSILILTCSVAGPLHALPSLPQVQNEIGRIISTENAECESACLHRLEMKRILQHKEYFTYTMKLHRLAQFGILVGVPFYQLYSLLNHMKSAPANAAEPVAVAAPKPPMLDRLMLFGKKCVASTVDPEAWISGAQSVGHIGAIVGTNIVLSKCSKIFDHDHTIHWCVRKHANYNTTMKQLKKNISEQLQTAQAEDSAFFEKSFVSSYGILINQLEYIIGFIKYKSESLSENKVEEGKAIAHYLIKTTNELGDTLEELRSSSEVSLNQYLKLFAEFNQKLTSEIEHFALIDSEKDEQEDENRILRSQVGDLAEENVKLRATLLAAMQNAGLATPDMTEVK